jgi:hypothetical protein
LAPVAPRIAVSLGVTGDYLKNLAPLALP